MKRIFLPMVLVLAGSAAHAMDGKESGGFDLEDFLEQVGRQTDRDIRRLNLLQQIPLEATSLRRLAEQASTDADFADVERQLQALNGQRDEYSRAMSGGMEDILTQIVGQLFAPQRRAGSADDILTQRVGEIFHPQRVVIVSNRSGEAPAIPFPHQAWPSAARDESSSRVGWTTSSAAAATPSSDEGQSLAPDVQVKEKKDVSSKEERRLAKKAERNARLAAAAQREEMRKMIRACKAMTQSQRLDCLAWVDSVADEEVPTGDTTWLLNIQKKALRALIRGLEGNYRGEPGEQALAKRVAQMFFGSVARAKSAEDFEELVLMLESMFGVESLSLVAGDYPFSDSDDSGDEGADGAPVRKKAKR